MSMSRHRNLIPVKCAALVVALTLQARTAAAQATSPRKVALTTSLVTPFFGAYLLEGTVRTSTSLGLLANCSYLSIENPKDEAWHAHAGTVGAGVDYYLPLGLTRRVYVEAVGEAVFASWQHQPSGRVAPLGVGYTAIAMAGYRYVSRSGPVLDVGAGAVAIHFARARVELPDGSSAVSGAFTNVYPALKVHVGWAF
jgi:hypothetical protein